MNSNQRPRARFTATMCVFGLVTGLSAFVFIPCSAMAAPSMHRITAPLLAQDEGSGDESEVPPDQVNKYIEVYKAMQHNRSLTVEQAAARQGFTLEAFRQLENKIERDDSAREHVQEALQAAATATSSPTPAAHSSPKRPTP